MEMAGLPLEACGNDTAEVVQSSPDSRESNDSYLSFQILTSNSPDEFATPRNIPVVLKSIA
jgi:hypothetical protein